MGKYICDFVCLEAGLVVELDGSQHAADSPYDEARDAYWRAHGYRVLRVWNGQVFTGWRQSSKRSARRSIDRMDGRFD